MKVVDNMAIDSHMHINSMVLRDIEAINKSHSIKSVVNVGLNIETSKESVLISKKNSKFYSSIGLHPLYTSSQDVDSLYMLADNDKVIAIGEIGLDIQKIILRNKKGILLNKFRLLMNYIYQSSSILIIQIS